MRDRFSVKNVKTLMRYYKWFDSLNLFTEQYLIKYVHVLDKLYVPIALVHIE